MNEGGEKCILTDTIKESQVHEEDDDSHREMLLVDPKEFQDLSHLAFICGKKHMDGRKTMHT